MLTLLFFDNKRFSFLLTLPCGRTRSLNIVIFLKKSTIVRFVDVALRAASTMKSRVCFVFVNALEVSKHHYLARFEHQEYGRTLSFEKICRVH